MKEIEQFDIQTQFELDFQKLFEDPLVPVEWSNEKKQRVMELTSDARLSSARVASIPMTCRGASCIAAGTCPLYKENLHPFGSICPIEAKLVGKLMYNLMHELEVDPGSVNEVGMIRDLVDQEIQQMRKQSLLSQENIIQENVIGISEDGEPIMKKELHLAVAWEDRIHKRKTALRKELLASRSARVSAGAKIADSAANMAYLLETFTRREFENQKVLRDVGLGPVDDYIEAQEALNEGLGADSNEES